MSRVRKLLAAAKRVKSRRAGSSTAETQRAATYNGQPQLRPRSLETAPPRAEYRVSSTTTQLKPNVLPFKKRKPAK